MTDPSLTAPYIPVVVEFRDSDSIEYVTRDCACLHEDVDANFAIIRDMDTREIIGFRLDGFSKIIRRADARTGVHNP